MNWGTYIRISPACHHHLLTETSASCTVPLKYFWRSPRMSHICLQTNFPWTCRDSWGPPVSSWILAALLLPQLAHTHETLGGVFTVSCAISDLDRAVPSLAGVTPVIGDSSSSALSPISFPTLQSPSPRLSPPGKPLQRKPQGFQRTPDSFSVQTRIFQTSEMRTKSTKRWSPSPLLWTELFCKMSYLIFLRGERIPHESF